MNQVKKSIHDPDKEGREKSTKWMGKSVILMKKKSQQKEREFIKELEINNKAKLNAGKDHIGQSVRNTEENITSRFRQVQERRAEVEAKAEKTLHSNINTLIQK
jgi:hypothetical protein